jgi:short-subunit dehydrogenase
VHGTQAFLPHLKLSRDGHVVNISSVFGLTSIPSQSAYNSAKFAVRGFSDALRIELDIEKCGVSSTTIHPGGIRTNIARNARIDASAADLGGADRADMAKNFERVARTSPDRAATQILAAVQANRRRALIGFDANVIDFLSRLPGSLLHRLIAMGGSFRR